METTTVLRTTIPAVEGVFHEWLARNPTAAVKFTSQPYVAKPSTPSSATTTTTAMTLPTSKKEEEEKTTPIEKALAERNARLVPYTKWSPSNSKVKFGAFKIKIDPSTNIVRLPDMNSQVFQMETIAENGKQEDIDYARFLKFNEDGYLLVKRAVAKDCPALLQAKQDMIAHAEKKYKLSIDPQTLEARSVVKPTAKKRMKMEISETTKLEDAGKHTNVLERSLIISSQALLATEEFQQVVESLRRGASLHHKQNLTVNHRSSWGRMRGSLPPRKEWTEFYFFRDHEPNEAEKLRWDRRYAREISRRKDAPKPRYAFNVWVHVCDVPVEHGGMAICPGSHHFSGFVHQARALDEVPVDFKKQCMGMPWVVENMEAGDILLIDMQVARAYVQNSTPNVTICADSMLILS